MSNSLDYSNGFIAGWNAACRAFGLSEQKPKEIPIKSEKKCPVCGISSGAEPLGVRCQHPLCPTNL